MLCNYIILTALLLTWELKQTDRQMDGSGTIRILLLFSGLRRFAYLERGVRATGRN